MNFYSYLYFLLLFLALYVAIFITNKIVKLEITSVKYPEIDGLRGYLAFFVFLHHSYIWNVFLKTKNWNEPKSSIFNHFGQTSVVFFFIITAFLFITKLIETKSPEFDWKRYITSRFLRMFPMYFISIITVFVIVLFLSNFEQRDSIFNIIKSALSWLFFSINGTTDLNGFKDTFLINSGVTWTLPYEWMFYFLLPVFALFFKIKVKPKIILLFTFTFLVLIAINQSSIKHFMPFVGGILAAICIHKLNLRNLLQRKVFTLIALILLCLSVCFFESGRKPVPIIIATIVFIIIASGNSFFGLFSSVFSRKFGQITYSLYLIHGTLLFIVFYYIIGFENAAKMTDFEYWSVITMIIFLLIFISQITFKYIEKPLMNYNKKNPNESRSSQCL